MNSITLLGHLTKDPEVFYSESGVATMRCALAVNDRKANKTLFVDIAAFNRLGELMNQYLRKGSKIAVIGRLDYYKWVDKTGVKRSKHSVVIDTLEMLGDSKKSQTQEDSVEVGGSNQITKDFYPEHNIEISEDDIPF